MFISHSTKYLGKLGKWSFAIVRLIRLHNRKMLTLLFSLIYVEESERLFKDAFNCN